MALVMRMRRLWVRAKSGKVRFGQLVRAMQLRSPCFSFLGEGTVSSTQYISLFASHTCAYMYRDSQIGCRQYVQTTYIPVS